MGAETRVLLVSDHGLRAVTELTEPGYSRVFSGREPFPARLGFHADQVEWIQGLDYIYLSACELSGVSCEETMKRAAVTRRLDDGTPVWTVGFRDGFGEYCPYPLCDDATRGWVELRFHIPNSWADTTLISLPPGNRPLAEFTVSADEIVVQGGHDPRGVFLAWGSGIRPAERLNTVHHLDILPTLLSLLNLPGAQDLRGVSADILYSGVAKQLPPPVATYEKPPWVPLQLPQDRERELARKALREEMRSRGYIN